MNNSFESKSNQRQMFKSRSFDKGIIMKQDPVIRTLFEYCSSIAWVLDPDEFGNRVRYNHQFDFLVMVEIQ